jgi:hypothetical protein
MTVFKQTKSSTALARFIALPIMVGALAGCDFASKLPDAPNNLGGFDLGSKPPSVTGPGELTRLPPPDDAFAKLKAPVEDRTGMPEAPSRIAGEAPRTLNTALGNGSTALPVPGASGAETAFAPLEFEAIEAPTGGVETAGFSAPPLDTAPQGATPTYQPLDTGTAFAGIGQDDQMATAYDLAETDGMAYSPSTGSAPSYQSYDSASVDSYTIAAPPAMPTYEPTSAVAPPASPITVRSARLPNGAVVNVHPIIGAPGTSSATLADAVANSLGRPVDRATAQGATVSFDLRARATRNADGSAGVQWRLYDASNTVVGVFGEQERIADWQQTDTASLQDMGRRIGTRVAGDSDVRRSALLAASNVPAYGETQSFIINGAQPTVQAPMTTTYVIPQGGSLNAAPMPRVSPRIQSQPIMMAAEPVRTAPVSMSPVQSAPIRTAPVAAPLVQTQPTRIASAPAPLRAPQAIEVAPLSPRITAEAPRQVAPPPSFDTLRAANNSQPVQAPTVVASGPRPLVFRGVNGAPGDGDVALSREVGKLLAQSGARLSTTPEPGALFLMAQVSKTPGANSDRIEIVWRVEDASGESVGQVTQANDVPSGMLDNAWGEDAIYAAEGARDGIMELLEGVGALES